MAQNYPYAPLPPLNGAHPLQPSPMHSPNSHHTINDPRSPHQHQYSISDPRSPQQIAPNETQPYPHSPYVYPPPPQEIQQQPQHQHALDYRQPTSPNYTHSPNQSIALPPMAAPIEQGYNIGPPTMDTTGQLAPPGMRPRLTTSVFEEEGSICFQVDVGGICVARREDNHMINGTKLLNVTHMTRGRRDGILKAEKQKVVVKIGPMHLKGVWIPYERALALANQEKITEALYPLFVHDIGGLLYHPINAARPVPVGGGGNINVGGGMGLPRVMGMGNGGAQMGGMMMQNGNVHINGHEMGNGQHQDMHPNNAEEDDGRRPRL